MNERLKELAVQAGFIDRGTNHTAYMNFDHEKFAELIVKECADIAKHNVMNISTYSDAEFVEEQIKEHFGVK